MNNQYISLTKHTFGTGNREYYIATLQETTFGANLQQLCNERAVSGTHKIMINRNTGRGFET